MRHGARRTAALAAMVMLVAGASWAGAAEPAALTLTRDGKPLLRYNAGYLDSPKAEAPWYGRSGFIHPVYTPSGRVVTDDFPSDHLHQHGLMFAWTSARIGGQPVDFWNSAQRTGRVKHARTIRASENALTVELHHLDDTAQLPRLVLRETWHIERVPHESMSVFDLVSTQHCVMDRPLKIAEYHYGAMCVRGAAEWIGGGATMRTSEGKGRADGNHTRPHWVAMYGEVDGAQCGIAAMGHPENFRAPQPVRLHPQMPYFCFAPMVAGEFNIAPGEPYVSRFRFVAFDGPPQPEQLDALWRDFGNKPVAE